MQEDTSTNWYFGKCNINEAFCDICDTPILNNSMVWMYNDNKEQTLVCDVCQIDDVRNADTRSASFYRKIVRMSKPITKNSKSLEGAIISTITASGASLPEVMIALNNIIDFIKHKQKQVENNTASSDI